MDIFHGIRPQFGSFIGVPHVWFAWKPVRCFDGRLVWFRKVYRQRCLIHGYLDNRGPDQWWMYAIAEVQP